VENLHESIRDLAVAYFGARVIEWHAGFQRRRPRDLPSNHLCCSQSFCVNAWLPFWQEPEKLALVLVDLGYPVEQVLPLPADSIAAQKELGFPVDEAASREAEEALSAGCVAFEWIGLRNYLHELLYGRVASDASRGRGKGFTSADFAFRFRRTDGRIQVILGEWKYTESYENGKSLRYGKKRAHGARTDRTLVYRRALESRGCQIRLGSSLALADLMYNPFDQMLRDQLLASAMEQAREMGADIVSYLHVAPKANRELVNRITAPALRGRGDEIHKVWRIVVALDRFHHICAEDILASVTENAPDQGWARWMVLRYGRME
jgi:hypothetical protein